MDLQAAKAEYERLCGWRERWLKLVNDKERMRRMGRLQKQMDYVCERSQRANIKIGVLLHKYWAAEATQIGENNERALYEKLKAKLEGSNVEVRDCAKAQPQRSELDRRVRRAELKGETRCQNLNVL